MGALTTVALILFAHSYVGELNRAGAFLTPTLAKTYEDGWYRLLIILGVATLIYSGISFYAGLVLTRNIVGPVLAFRTRIIKLLATRKAEDFEFRTHDELQVLKEIYLDVAEYVEGKSSRTKTGS